MKAKEKSRLRLGEPESGKGNQNNSSVHIVRRQVPPVNPVFSCGFVELVYDLLAYPITIESIARLTDSTEDRVRLALNDLQVAGVQIVRAYHDR